MAAIYEHKPNDSDSAVSAVEIDALDRHRDETDVKRDGENRDLIDQTIGLWQPRSERQLTREDGREIIENMTGFFRILQEWDRAERAAQSEVKVESADSPATA